MAGWNTLVSPFPSLCRSWCGALGALSHNHLSSFGPDWADTADLNTPRNNKVGFKNTESSGWMLNILVVVPPEFPRFWNSQFNFLTSAPVLEHCFHGTTKHNKPLFKMGVFPHGSLIHLLFFFFKTVWFLILQSVSHLASHISETDTYSISNHFCCWITWTDLN